jgi:hypothetical protein
VHSDAMVLHLLREWESTLHTNTEHSTYCLTVTLLCLDISVETPLARTHREKAARPRTRKRTLLGLGIQETCCFGSDISIGIFRICHFGSDGANAGCTARQRQRVFQANASSSPARH